MTFQNAPTLCDTASASFIRLRFRWEVGMGWVGIYFGLGWDSQLESSLGDTLIFCIILVVFHSAGTACLRKGNSRNQTKYMKGLKVKITFPFKLKFQIWYRKLLGKYIPLGCPDILSLLFSDLRRELHRTMPPWNWRMRTSRLSLLRFSDQQQADTVKRKHRFSHLMKVLNRGLGFSDNKIC